MTHGRELKRSQKTGEHEPQPTVVPARNQHGHSRMGVRRAGTVTVAWVCAWLWLVECSCERTLPALSARTLLTQRRRLLAATPQPAAGLEARLFVQRLVDGLPESVRQPTATCFAAASKGTTAVLTATQIDVKEFFDSLPEGARTPTVNCVAAGLAGTAAVLAATPIERMKVGLQTWPGSTLSGVVSRIVRLGPPGFFTGLDAMLLANVPYSIVFYGCYQPVRNMVNEKSWGAAGSGDEQGMGPMCAAGVANIVGTTFFMPGELVRMRMMHDPSRYTSFCQAVPTIVREEGAQTLFRGYRATLLRDIPYAMISFSLFEYLRSCLSRRNRDGTVSFGESAACRFCWHQSHADLDLAQILTTYTTAVYYSCIDSNMIVLGLQLHNGTRSQHVLHSIGRHQVDSYDKHGQGFHKSFVSHASAARGLANIFQGVRIHLS